MNIDQFLCEYFTDGDTATVNAVELQNLLKEYQSKSRKIKLLREQLETVLLQLQICKDRNTSTTGLYVDLKG